MSELLLRKGVVLAKLETTYGSDAGPGASNGILCSIPEHVVQADQRERNYMRDSLSPVGTVTCSKKQTIRFETEFKGPGSSTSPETATCLDALLRSCGWKPYEVLVLPVSSASGAVAGITATGGTSAAYGTVVRTETGKLTLKDVSGTFQADESITGTSYTSTVGSSPMTDARMEYAPSSDSEIHGSSTIHYYMDGIKHALVGARGTAKVEFAVNGYPSITFEFSGLYQSPSDSDAPSDVTFEEHTPPACLSAGFKINGYTPTGIQKITVDLGASVSERKCINSADGITKFVIGSRKPKVSVDFDIEALSSFNPYTLFEDSTKVPMSWHVGSTVGNRVFVHIPEAQLEPPGKADRDGVAIYNLSLLATGDDDEVILQTG